MIPSLHHEQMTTHVRFSGAFCIDPSIRMETRLVDFCILADYHPLVCAEILSRRSSGSPQMVQAKAVALRFHAEVLQALLGFRAIW